jgi:hypothetical protein
MQLIRAAGNDEAGNFPSVDEIIRRAGEDWAFFLGHLFGTCPPRSFLRLRHSTGPCRYDRLLANRSPRHHYQRAYLLGFSSRFSAPLYLRGKRFGQSRVILRTSGASVVLEGETA